MAEKVLKIHPRDNVLVALRDLPEGEQIRYDGQTIVLKERVAAKHKIVTEDLQAGDKVMMYGVLVGKAQGPIPRGAVISTENLKHDADPYEVRGGMYQWTPPDVSAWEGRTFMGYHRGDGQVGTRNYWLVVPLVFCENRNVHMIRQAFEKELGFRKPEFYKEQVRELADLLKENRLEDIRAYKAVRPDEYDYEQDHLLPNVDGIKFLTHEGGCGGTRKDATNLCALLAGFIHHPNVAGATVLSLGCQHAQTSILQEELKKRNPGFDKPVLYFEQQKWSSEFDMLSAAIKETFLGLLEANAMERQPAPLSKLTVGLKCGGSDGFSGISANPAMGHMSDLLGQLGGKTILAEFPELCGVEQELIDRCVNTDIAEKFARNMRSYNKQAMAVGSGFDMNPSPGNIKDGLITDAIKSAGAARKGGMAPVSDVLDYAEYATEPGLNLLCTPGNDVEATTGMVGSGANIIIFSTGLGTPTGNPVAPVIKTATNSVLAERLPDIIDFDHGDIISGEKSIGQSGEELLEFIIRVAGGDIRTKAENLGQDDFIPWKRGVSL